MEYQKIFEFHPDPKMLLRPDFSIVAYNPAFIKLIGPLDKWLGKSILDLPTRDQQWSQEFKASTERIMKSHATDAMTPRQYNNSDKFWKPKNIPLFDSKGNIEYILHTLEDISELIRTRNLTEEYKRFFTASLDMLCISSFDGFFKKVNPAFEKTLGFPEEAFYTNSYLYFIHPDDIEKTKQEVQRQLATGEQVLNFENRYRCLDGSYKILSWKSAPIGEYMYAVARDVTRSRLDEESLIRANEAIEISNQELESFSYSVAHDLRTPLRSIMGFSHIVLNDPGNNLTEESKKSLQRVISSSKRMGELIDALINLSRLTRHTLTKENINLSQLAKEIVTDLKSLDPTRAVEFKIQSDLMAFCDPMTIRSALLNLIGNAWKYTSKMTSTALIEVGSYREGSTTIFYVKDNGVGFDMKYVNKLFGVFQRLHADRDFEGTGIGLATVKRIINSHGGKIWAEAEENKGAAFYFTLS